MKAQYFSILITGILLSVTSSSCTKDEVTTFNSLKVQSSHPIDSDTLPAFATGTLLTGKTYYINQDVTVKKGDTLFAQPGSSVVVENNAQANILGVLQLIGTQDQPISFNSNTNTPGSWGGFQCDSAQAVTIKWVHVENTGGPDPSGSARRSVFVGAPIDVDIEDSWFTNGQDDLLSIRAAAKVKILRNTITSSGSTDGEAINLKSGVTGEVAYNVVYSQAGSGIKLETSKTVPFPQTDVNVYNNTLVSNGWRRGAAEPGRGISFGVNAKGNVYNNIIMDNYQGLEIFADADAAHIQHGNNLFYASVDNYTDNTVTPNISINLRDNFYPNDGVGKPDPSDLISTGVNNLNPMFMTFDGKVASPNGAFNGNNFMLQSGSPAYGSGNPAYNPDLGAYTSDGKGNKH
jgi:hypothetical protein